MKHFYVMPGSDGWCLGEERNPERAFATFPAQELAAEAARQILRGLGGGTLTLYGNGRRVVLKEIIHKDEGPARNRQPVNAKDSIA
ncbi:MAG TPA: hypothetical protein VG796_23975 [Verrucomicrobiales bacterium]|nr:hypothetical protein [Verrucomicrobiales bacterium]